MIRVTSRVPDFSKLPFARAPEQFADVGAAPWLAPEGISVAPNYRASNIGQLDCLDGFPGIAPYVRGPCPAMYVERPWTIRQYAGYSSGGAPGFLLESYWLTLTPARSGLPAV